MTTEQLRDWHASRAGYVNVGVGCDFWMHHTNPTVQVPHPFQNTIDGAASAFPKGWDWDRLTELKKKWWVAFPPDWDGEPYQTVDDTGDEINDRYLLAKLAWEQETR